MGFAKNPRPINKKQFPSIFSHDSIPSPFLSPKKKKRIIIFRAETLAGDVLKFYRALVPIPNHSSH